MREFNPDTDVKFNPGRLNGLGFCDIMNRLREEQYGVYGRSAGRSQDESIFNIGGRYGF